MWDYIMQDYIFVAMETVICSNHSLIPSSVGFASTLFLKQGFYIISACTLLLRIRFIHRFNGTRSYSTFYTNNFMSWQRFSSSSTLQYIHK